MYIQHSLVCVLGITLGACYAPAIEFHEEDAGQLHTTETDTGLLTGPSSSADTSSSSEASSSSSTTENPELTTSTSEAMGFCGDAIVDETEACDDGNDIDDDACSNICTENICGNGVIDPGEDCDDGEQQSGDGCSAGCKQELYLFISPEIYDGLSLASILAPETCTQMASSNLAVFELAPDAIFMPVVAPNINLVLSALSGYEQSPVIAPNGEVIAWDYERLFSGSLLSPPNQTVDGLPYNGHTWTGVSSFTLEQGATCHEWTTQSNGTYAHFGRSDAFDHQWLGSPTLKSCNHELPIYCLQVR